MQISVVIPAFNEEKYLGKTLQAVIDSLSSFPTDKPSWEIIVCDNNSTDETQAIALNNGAKVVFVEENQISLARNSGAKLSNGDWLLFIDADTFPSPALMSEVYDLMIADEIIGCGTTVTVTEGSLFNKLRMERLNPIFRLLNICGGAFVLCKADAFRTIDGFSHDLYALEDIDFVLRLKRYGRSQNKKFFTLYRNPVTTSGRKGDYSFIPMMKLFLSNIFAAILLGLHYILPKGIVKRAGKKLLGYWYPGPR